MRYLMILKEFDGIPEEFQVLPAGCIEIEGAEAAYLDEEGAREIIAAFGARKRDMVIDYEHQSLELRQAPAAGWITALVWKGPDGLWANASWTPQAAEYLRNREYRYYSPVMFIDPATRRVKSLVNVALTNTPAMNDLRPIVARLNHGTANTIPRKEQPMIDKLKKLFNLGAEATEEQIATAAEAVVAERTALAQEKASLVACTDVLAALGAKEGAGKDEVLRIVASLKAPGDVAVQLSHQVAELTKTIAEMRQADLVAVALSEGKTSPEELDKWGRALALKDPEQFKLIVLSRPAGSIIPVEGIGKAPPARDAGGLDDVQRSINALCGVDDETFKKYNK